MQNSEKIPVGTAEDLTGKVFGKLTVLYRVKNTGKTRGAKWRCQCSCDEHNEVDVLASNLKRGHTTSCGCTQKSATAKAHFNDLTNQRFGRLVAKYCLQQPGQRTKWHCICDCGNETDVDVSSLTRGITTSCGCYRLERIQKRAEPKYLGKKFLKLTVIKHLEERDSNGDSLWECLCDCGKTCVVSTSDLGRKASCGCASLSSGMVKIINLLDENNISYSLEKTFDSCRLPSGKHARFDIFVDNRYLIEFDGRQHFEATSGWNSPENFIKTKERDAAKNLWCKENQVPLIRIPYTREQELNIDDLRPETSQFLIKQEEED